MPEPSPEAKPRSAPLPWAAPTVVNPVTATVRLPGSKSVSARALVLAALGDRPSELRWPLRARDTALMADGLVAMGAAIDQTDDARWRVVPGRLHGPATVDVGLAGTVMRFLPALATLATGPVRFDGDPQARLRPLAALVSALRSLGVRVEASPTGGLPLTVHGAGRVGGGEVVLDASGSSQLISALLLVAPHFEQGLVVRHAGPPVPSAAHLRMTVEMLRNTGITVDDSAVDTWVVHPGRGRGGTWQIEPDLSGAAPFLAAAMVTGGTVTIPGWPARTTQPGDRLRDLLDRMGGRVTLTADGLTVAGSARLHGIDVDLREVAELTPVLAALAALAEGPSNFHGIGHIRGHETDRLAALAAELTRLGASVTEHRDGLTIRPGRLRGCRFGTYDDHRMAHAGAVIGLVVPGVELTDISCTTKTMPEFPRLWSTMVASARETAGETAGATARESAGETAGAAGNGGTA